MSELDPQSSDVSTFLSAHAHTGEPTAAELAAVEQRVRAATRPVVRKRLVPPEFLAAAAVLTVAIGGAGVWRLAHRADDARQSAQHAYVSGDLEGARLAATSCTEPACVALADDLGRVLELSGRFDTLDAADLDELEALDTKLTGDEPAQTGLSTRIAERRAMLANPGDAEARQLLAAKACVKDRPKDPACWLQLGELLLRKAAVEDSAETYNEGAAAWNRFLILAPPDDPNVPRVKAVISVDRTVSGPDTATPDNELRLSMGETRVINFSQPGLQRVAVGNPQVLDVRTIGGGALQLVANEPGSTTLLVWLTDTTRRAFLVRVADDGLKLTVRRGQTGRISLGSGVRAAMSEDDSIATATMATSPANTVLIDGVDEGQTRVRLKLPDGKTSVATITVVP